MDSLQPVITWTAEYERGRVTALWAKTTNGTLLPFGRGRRLPMGTNSVGLDFVEIMIMVGGNPELGFCLI